MNNFGSHPIAEIDYPETLQQFDSWFATEQAVCISPVPYKKIIDDGHQGQ